MIQAAFESPLAGGLEQERQAFFEVFASKDRLEGMHAFIEKREARWSGD
jgi:enoyl-CoA hydratase